MFVIGSNNRQQTIERLNIARESLRDRPAKLPQHRREFVGLSTTRSHGAVANARYDPYASLKGAVMFIPKMNKDGERTLKLMDKKEGYPKQYDRKRMDVACYPGKTAGGGAMHMIRAWVYVMAPDRARKITRSRSGSKKKWPRRSWNNGMVSIQYIKAVRRMLDETWKTNYDPEEEFSPSASLLMFQWKDCKTRRNKKGKVYRYIPTSRRRIASKACPLGEVVNTYVKKYRVKNFVRHSDRRKVRV